MNQSTWKPKRTAKEAREIVAIRRAEAKRIGHDPGRDWAVAEWEKHRAEARKRIETVITPEGWTPKQKSRGLGDTIAKVTSALGIKPCGGCKGRQEKLNKLVPYHHGKSKAAAIVPYFNFARSRSRTRNYYECVGHLRSIGFDVFTAEAAMEGHPFDVPKGPKTLRFTVCDPLFMKETLFNLMLKTLPDSYSTVAVVDGDVLFDRNDMAAATAEALKTYRVVQMFREARWMDAKKTGVTKTNVGLARGNIVNGTATAAHATGWPGLAWAMRRNVVDEIGGLYDGHQVGSGDTFASAAFYGDNPPYFAKYHYRMLDAFWQNWGKRCFDAVQGSVGYVDATIYHLYHGELENRQYLHRHEVLNSAGFDPTQHLERGPNGIYRFTADCPKAAREWITRYMLEMRHEP